MKVPAYVLRFWETEFKRISPKRTSSGQRLYRKSDIELILKIKHLLYEKKFTIEGAKQQLKSETADRKKKVEKITLEVAKQIQLTTAGAVKDFEPAFRFKEFGDSNINFIAILRVSEPLKRFVVRNEFIKALKKRFDKENIEISWPIRKIYQIK